MMYAFIALMLKHKQQHTVLRHFINGIDIAFLTYIFIMFKAIIKIWTCNYRTSLTFTVSFHNKQLEVSEVSGLGYYLI